MKKGILLALIAMSVSIGFSSCNGNEPENKTAQVQLLPEGGVFSLDNGVTIVVPEGAVTEATDVQVEYLTDLDESVGNLPSDIQGRLKLMPEGLTFNKPLEVSIPLNQPVAEGLTDIVWWSTKDNLWYFTDLGQVNGDKVTFYIEHFSDYASMGGGWGSSFRQMDEAVGDAASEEAISAEVLKFLQHEIWEKRDLAHMRVAMYANGQMFCAKPCGLFGFFSEEKDGVVRQGGGRYLDQSTHNLVIHLSMSDAQATQHLNQDSQGTHVRMIEMYLEPCPTELEGSASPGSIEKGKKAEVTITALCDGSPLAGQLIQLSYSPELSCDVVNKKTDSNGQVTVSVKGEEEGNGIVYAKAVSALDPNQVTEIQVPVKVGNGEQWRITIDVTERISSSWAEANDGGGAYPSNYQFEGGDQSIEYGYTIVYDLTIKDMSQQYGMAGVGEITGKCSVTNHPDRFRLNVPAFTQSGQMINEAWGIVINCSSSQSMFTASPEYHNLSYVPLYGSCYPQGGKRYMGLFAGVASADDIADYETTVQLMYQYAFLVPNVRGTWSWIEDEQSDNGSYFFGNVPIEQSDQYNELAMLSLYGLIEIEDLKEEETPFQFTEDGLSMSEIEIGSSKFGLSTLHNIVGRYTNWYPGHWEGKRHRSASGTLKIENLSKGQ